MGEHRRSSHRRNNTQWKPVAHKRVDRDDGPDMPGKAARGEAYGRDHEGVRAAVNRRAGAGPHAGGMGARQPSRSLKSRRSR